MKRVGPGYAVQAMSTDTETSGQSGTAGSVWAPLLIPIFRSLWIAQFVANIGTWAQTVSAQWLMGDLGGGPLAVAGVQSALTFPVFLLVVPSGALADMFTRRSMLLVSRALMTLGAVALAVLATLYRVVDLPVMNPWVLLVLIGLVGAGQGIGMAASEAVLRDLVPLEQIGNAAILDGVSFNAARAIGPALGGLLIAVIGPRASFTLNAVAFIAVLVVLFTWSPPREEKPLGIERFRAALRAGARYVAGEPLFARVLGRLMLFMIFAGGLWGLLPNVARDQLQLGSNGYGLLLGCLGLGAAAGAFILPFVRRRLATDMLISASTVLYAVALGVVGYITWLPAVVVALAGAGLTWIGTQSTFIATAQLLLPDWTRARALAYFHLVLMGGQSFGAFAWGTVAESTNLPLSFGIPAVGLLVLGVLGRWVIRLPTQPPDLRETRYLPEPPETKVHPEAGPVLVVVEWRIEPANVENFVHAMRQVGNARRRTGARIWGLFRSVDDSSLFMENFIVGTWQEYLRQHYERSVQPDRQAWERAESYIVPGTHPQHRHFIGQAVARTPRARLSIDQLSPPANE